MIVITSGYRLNRIVTSVCSFLLLLHALPVIVTGTGPMMRYFACGQTSKPVFNMRINTRQIKLAFRHCFLDAAEGEVAESDNRTKKNESDTDNATIAHG